MRHLKESQVLPIGPLARSPPADRRRDGRGAGGEGINPISCSITDLLRQFDDFLVGHTAQVRIEAGIDVFDDKMHRSIGKTKMGAVAMIAAGRLEKPIVKPARRT